VKVLIISTKYTGMGHHSISSSIVNELNERNIDSKVIEIFDYTAKMVKKISSQYATVVEKKPKTWKFFYNLADRLPKVQAWYYGWGLRKKFVKIVKDYQPDIVVTVHPNYVTNILNYRKRYHLNFKFVTVIADLITINSCFVDERADLTIFPTKAGYQYLSNSKKIDFFHLNYAINIIPVRKEFIPVSKAIVLADKEKDFTTEPLNVLVMSGGNGMSTNNSLLDELLKIDNIKISMVCGSNAEKKEQLTALYKDQPKLNVLGFVTDMPSLLQQQDVAILRASPNTILECLAMCVPIILISYVYGQEKGNVNFVVNNKIGYYAPTLPEIINAINELKTNPSLVNEIRQREFELRQLDAAQTLVNNIVSVL
jgi:processive 1,2-diacylglycerol beta-glucosyltransferase